MKQTWPIIRKVLNHGKIAFQVDGRFSGKGERRFFPTRAEAEGYAQTCRIRRKNEGSAASGDARLAAYGWSVRKAILFALEHLERRAASVPVSEAIAALVAFKADRVGNRRLPDIRNRLARFAAHFDGKVIAAVTADDINGFLAEIQNPTTRNDYRKEIVMLWSFARSKKWVAEPIDKNLVHRAAEPEKARVILSVEESRRLMLASHDEDIRALIALVLFAGCRREEVEKLDWRNINFRTGHVEISAECSKVHRERFAPLPANCRAWLEPLAQASGPIIARNLMRPLRVTWKRAGLHPWPQDAHRHSFISYRRRIIGDAQTALDAGTSESIIKKHYKRPVTQSDAEAFFQIVPCEDAKIIPIAAAS